MALHVSFVINDGQMWPLIKMLEEHTGVRDIEIQHVANGPPPLDTTLLALPNEQPTPAIRGFNQRKVWAVMPRTPVNPRGLAGSAGLRPKQVAMALFQLSRRGIVKRIALGEYVRIS